MKSAKRILALLLAVCMLVTATVVIYAEEQELYLADIRIVYAKDYNEAKKILQNTEFKDYNILDYNLNKSATKVDLGFVTIGDQKGVYLAYKTTTNVDDAITDIAIMQMNGGYREGNYLEMVENSRKEYEKVGMNYIRAINYMVETYHAGHFLAICAYRQLELYYDDDSKMTLGAYFETQPGADAIAKIFLEGNSYAVKNIRSLIGMGVSYNGDGMTYLEKVSEAALEMDDDAEIYDEEGYEDLAETISNSIITFREMLEEHATVEKELNFDDEEFTDLEIQYTEHQALAEMLRRTTYLGGKTLYDFCLKYYKDESDYTSLYPLVHALNDGQKAITIAGNYYDAIRYSMSDMPEEFLDEEITKLENTYADKPFSIYSGVDRSIFKQTFALTSEAYRADVSSDKGFMDSVYSLDDWKRWSLEITSGVVGAGVFAYAIYRTKNWIAADSAAKASNVAYAAAKSSRLALETKIHEYSMNTFITIKNGAGQTLSMTPHQFINDVVKSYCETYLPFDPSTVDVATSNLFISKANYCNGYLGNMPSVVREQLDEILEKTQKIIDECYPQGSGYEYGQALPTKVAATSLGSKIFTVTLYAVGAALMAYAAYSYGSQVVSYYNPTYTDIPTAMIDLVVTEYGDRYIKYDAVTMAEMNAKKEYDPADLNAFGGQRWNAIYYTKSYEAGKPLLASAASFKVVTNNNVAQTGYLPVHRFGESVCYDLNKYNFSYEDSIYLSIKQSENQKTAITDVPDIVGSILGGGLYFITAGLGVVGGVLGTIGTQKLKKRKKEKELGNQGETDEPDTDVPALDTDALALDTDAPAPDTDAPAPDTDAPTTDSGENA